MAQPFVAGMKHPAQNGRAGYPCRKGSKIRSFLNDLFPRLRDVIPILGSCWPKRGAHSLCGRSILALLASPLISLGVKLSGFEFFNTKVAKKAKDGDLTPTAQPFVAGMKHPAQNGRSGCPGRKGRNEQHLQSRVSASALFCSYQRMVRVSPSCREVGADHLSASRMRPISRIFFI